MRTTLTLDEDVVAKLKAEARRSGKAFREVVNETLRAGLMITRRSVPRARVQSRARDLGSLKPGLRIDSVADLLDQTEGPLHQ